MISYHAIWAYTCIAPVKARRPDGVLKACLYTPICTLMASHYLKERCHDNQLSGKNGAKLPKIAFIALSFQYGMGYCYLNERINSLNGASKSC